MKKLFLPTLLFFIFISCNDSGDKKIIKIPKTGDEKIVAVITNRDGTKTLEGVLRRIYKGIKFDSVNKVDVVVYDTLFGKGVNVKAIDSVGNILKTHDGKDSINPNPVYIPIGRDSVQTNVSNISIDSLLRK